MNNNLKNVTQELVEELIGSVVINLESEEATNGKVDRDNLAVAGDDDSINTVTEVVEEVISDVIEKVVVTENTKLNQICSTASTLSFDSMESMDYHMKAERVIGDKEGRHVRFSIETNRITNIDQTSNIGWFLVGTVIGVFSVALFFKYQCKK